MSMIGEYLRVTPAELERAVEDPDWALELAEQVQDTEEETEPSVAEARHFSTYKCWDMLGFLFRRAGFPVDVVHGEEPLTEEDWGYGPPKYLPVERARLAAEALGRVSYDDLVQGVDPAELTRAEVYPLIWDGAETLEWARSWYVSLVTFFSAAARTGDAVLVWLD